jgi:LysR family cys regulon transcriptional activator
LNFNQLRFIREIAQCGLSVSAAASALNTSQPAVSKQVRLLEDEIGVKIFTRAGNRLTSITPEGKMIITIAEEIIQSLARIKNAGRSADLGDVGVLTIGTSHTHARYVLPQVLHDFVERYPKVILSLRHGTPPEVKEWIRAGTVDIGIIPFDEFDLKDIVVLPCRTYDRVVIFPKGHPLAKKKNPTIADLAKYSFVGYSSGYSTRNAVQHAFQQAGLAPTVILSASDADVIKDCVGLGLGIAVISSVVLDPSRDKELGSLSVKHLFPSSLTCALFQRRRYLRRYEYDFIKMVSPRWTRAIVERYAADQLAGRKSP